MLAGPAAQQALATLPAPHCANPTQGQLFTQDFLHRGICDTPPWQTLDAPALVRFEDELRRLFAPYTAESTLNEAQTEQLLIEQVQIGRAHV